MSNPPTHPLIELYKCDVTPPAAASATMLRGFPANRLEVVEHSWTPARKKLADAMATAGLQLEHSHWRWTRKVDSIRHGDHVVIAVEADGAVQGLLALKTRLRESMLVPGQWVLYVDYIEAAPWNLNVPNIQKPRFAGVGTLLIGEAIRTSIGRTTRGRIGLHSLAQSAKFYAEHCKMTPIGPDVLYHGLVYFEYSDDRAIEWLSDVGLSA